jgi:PAS domain S-box-containing protein
MAGLPGRLRDIMRAVPGRRKAASRQEARPRINLLVLLLLVPGIGLEIAAGMLYSTWGHGNPLDEILSFAGISFITFVVAFQLRLRGRLYPITFAAAFFVIFSKFIDVTRNISALSSVPLFGFDYPWSRAIEIILMTTGILLLVLNLLIYALLSKRAQRLLHARNRDLEKEIEKSRQALQALQESERLIAALMDSAPDAISFIGGDHRYQRVNRAFAESAGYADPGAVAGKAPEDIFAPEYAEKKALTYRTVFETGQPLEEHQEEEILADGRRRWVSRTLTPVFNSGEAVESIAEIKRDITLQRHQQETVRRSEERLQLVLGATSDGFFDNHVACDDVYYSPQYARLLGYEPHEAGTDFSFWQDRVHPEDLPGLLNEIEQISMEEQDDFEFEHRMRHRQGHWIHVYSGGRVVERGLDGRPLRVVGSFRDITARKQGEEQRMLLETAIDQAVEAVIVTGTDGAIRYVNPAFEAMSGFSRGEVVGQKPDIFESGRHEQGYMEAFWETIAAGHVWTGHFINKRRDGSLYEVAAVISPVRNAKKEITAFVSLQRDVTHEMYLEEQLRQGQKMQAIGVLAGGIAHDFRNILSLILGHCEIALNKMPHDHDLRPHFQHIRKAGNRAADLVRQILTFSRQTEQERRPLNIGPVVEEALKLIAATTPATIAIHQDISGDDAVIMGDPAQIHQVVMNLCSNAVFAMRGGGRLDVRLDTIAVEADSAADIGNIMAGTHVRLTVCDTGPGIDEGIRDHIFEPFYTTKKHGDGTGLGLSTVHGIVMACGGALRLENRPEGGASFEVYFPLLSDGELEAEEPDALETISGKGVILIIDDDADLVDMAAQLLESMGFEVQGAYSPAEAITCFAAAPARWDLIITDNIMPGMTGIELAGRIRKQRRDLPIILMTGFSEDIASWQDGMAAFSAHIMKPFTSAEIGAIIQTVMAEED